MSALCSWDPAAQAAELSRVKESDGQPGHVTWPIIYQPCSRPVTVTRTRRRSEVATSTGLARGDMVRSQEVNPAATINSLWRFLWPVTDCAVLQQCSVLHHSLFILTLTPTSPRSVRISSSYGFFPTPHEITLNSKVLIMTNQRAVLQMYPEAPLIRAFLLDSPCCNSALFNDSLADLDKAHDGGLVVVVM